MYSHREMKRHGGESGVEDAEDLYRVNMALPESGLSSPYGDAGKFETGARGVGVSRLETR